MKKLYFLLFSIAITSLSFGQIMKSDSFDYPDGSLVPNGGWVNHSGNAGDLMVVSGQVLVQHGSPSEDAELVFSSVSGNIYYGIDFTVIDPGGPISGSDSEYFIHLKMGNNTNFPARVDVVPPSSSGDFSIGIATGSSTADATWPTDLTFGTTYRAIVRYDQDNNIAQLWLNAASDTDPSLMGADESDPGQSVTSIGLRQSDSSNNEGILVDNLIVSQSFSDAVLSDSKYNINTFKVFPNPTSRGYVNITSQNTGTTTVNVFDILGKQVISRTLNNNRLDLSELRAGMYLMKITQNNASITKKLVIQ